MVGTIARLLGLDSLIVYAIIALLAGGSLWGYGAYKYHAGGSAMEAKWSLKYDQREVAITKAYNDRVSHDAQANAMAKAVEAKRIAEVEADNAALELKIKELSDAANADPDRDRVCLSDGSGMRIDSIH